MKRQCIILSVNPTEAEAIISGKKSILIRKQFPSSYHGRVYLYCIKGKNPIEQSTTIFARFECDSVNYILNINGKVRTQFFTEKELLKRTAMKKDELDAYLKGKTGNAIHIESLKVFEIPLSLADANFVRPPLNYYYIKECTKWKRIK